MRATGPLALRLSDHVRDALGADLRREETAGHPGPDADHRALARTGAKHLGNHLPADLLGHLTAWRCEPTPWLTLRNLPGPGRPVPTPRDGFGDEAALTVPNLLHFGMLRLLGLTPVAYRWENAGRLVRNVAPRPDAGRALTSWGYAAALDWHTDDSVLDHRACAEPAAAIPHHLSFYGMRNDERVATDLLALDAVLPALPGGTTLDLRRPEFTVAAPESYAAGGRPRRTGVPLLWTLPDGRTAVRYGPDLITGETPRAVRALTRLTGALAAAPAVPVLIGPGDFHVFDNRRVLHRRAPFHPAPPGAARWLRRCYARER